MNCRSEPIIPLQKQATLVINYVTEKRTTVALAVLAVLEANLHLNDLRSHRVWFTYDGVKGSACVQCLDDYWMVTWDFCREQPHLKTYEDLLKRLQAERSDFLTRSSQKQH